MSQGTYYNLHNFTTYGSLGISQKVLEDITRLTLSEIDQVILPDEKKCKKYRHRSIKCDIVTNTNDVVIYLNLGIKYGNNVTDISALIQDRLDNALLAMLDIRPKKIFIKIGDVK